MLVIEHLFPFLQILKGRKLKKDVVIGIDPGLANTGWGVIRIAGSQIKPVAYGCISTKSQLELPARLALIHDDLCKIIDKYQPTALGAESVYFAANAVSAVLTAQARGAALVACSCKGLAYGEYSPPQIKKALVGTGFASKEQVQYMVKAILNLDHTPKPDHAADALAAAITYARLHKAKELEKKVTEIYGLDVAATKKAQAQARRAFEKRVAAALAKEK